VRVFALLAFILTPLRKSSCATAIVTLTLTLTLSQLRVNSWSNELVVKQWPAGKNVSTVAEGIVGIRNQATTGKDESEKILCVLWSQ
jgi:hypothetical protein